MQERQERTQIHSRVSFPIYALGGHALSFVIRIQPGAGVRTVASVATLAILKLWRKA